MELWIKYLIVIVIGYLLGSLNFSIIISKALMGRDIRSYGSGNAGSTNSYRMMGGKKTIIVMLGDLLKGIVAVLIAGIIFGELGQLGGMGKLAAGAATVVGHIFPIFFGLKGGKGILTAAAVFGMVDYRILVIILSVFIIMVLITKIVSLSSVCAAAALPVSVAILYSVMSLEFVICFALGALVIFMHRSNLVRLARGEEKKFSFKRKGDDK